MFTASISGPQSRWTEQEHMMALIVDLLAAANWQRAGKKTAPKPKRLPRPGDKSRNARTFGSGALPAARLDEWIKAKEDEAGRRHG